MKLSIVVPTYNERENIGVLIPLLISIMKQRKIQGEVLVIDDMSPDGTAGVVKRLEKSYRNVRLYQKAEKVGIGAAYKFGFPHCRGQYVMEMDADLSHNPDEFMRFVDKLDAGYDLVVGSRYIKGGTRSDPVHRRIFPKIGNWLYKYLLKFPATDTTSGYRAYRKSVLDKINMRRMPNDFSFQSAMVLEFARRGFRVAEVPISFKERAAGQPKYSFKDLLGNMKLLLVLMIGRRSAS